MGLLFSSTLRVFLLFWFVGGSALAVPTYHSRGSTTANHAIRAVTQDLMDEASRAVVGGEGQGRLGQRSASDGSGSGFDLPAVLWLSFALAVGSYLTLGGMRLWRITTGVAIGLVLAFSVWVAVTNVISAEGATGIVLTLITLTFFALGSLGGLFKFCRLAGMIALSILGGMSVGMRVVLLREGLLLRPTALNWIIIAVPTAAGVAVTQFRLKIGVALSCTLAGTFFLSLGIDLGVNQQHGMSSGLRHLLNVNRAHALVLHKTPYQPPISTQITLCISIGFALIMAYVQFRFFSGYLEEPSRTRPVIGHLSSSSMGKRNTDITLHLPLQEPPTDQMNDRLRL